VLYSKSNNICTKYEIENRISFRNELRCVRKMLYKLALQNLLSYINRKYVYKDISFLLINRLRMYYVYDYLEINAFADYMYTQLHYMYISEVFQSRA